MPHEKAGSEKPRSSEPTERLDREVVIERLIEKGATITEALLNLKRILSTDHAKKEIYAERELFNLRDLTDELRDDIEQLKKDIII